MGVKSTTMGSSAAATTSGKARGKSSFDTGLEACSYKENIKNLELIPELKIALQVLTFLTEIALIILIFRAEISFLLIFTEIALTVLVFPTGIASTVLTFLTEIVLACTDISY